MLHALYTRHPRSLLRRGPLPRHVALVMDGNRRRPATAAAPLTAGGVAAAEESSLSRRGLAR
ncbi:hypothetical protein [Nonomuraea dietziae]|uniref:hypothetical protein n=1 Tax=Nonomuraea dietziae TaxID=65515 RepID=UPI00341ADA06